MWFFFLFILAFVLGVLLYLNLNPQFGANVNSELASRYSNSSHWDGKHFVNLSDTSMNIGVKDIPGLLKAQFTAPERSPSHNLGILPLDRERFDADSAVPKFVWYGHSVLLLQLQGKNFLIDPMLGPNAAPVAPFPVKRFSKDTLAIIDALPPLDAVLLTHDHYDHLDYASIKKLRGKVDTWLVGLGIARHLEGWGIPAEQITEFDWWQEHDFEGIQLIYTPSRHFSGRGPTDRAKSLWGGWAFIGKKHRIYWTGDGGYDTHFSEVGEKYGPFDWAFVECGQYNTLWQQIHMMPEESVQAAIDVRAHRAIPVHWAGFSLALHRWYDPADSFLEACQQKGVPPCLPKLGQVIVMDEEYPAAAWWRADI